MTISDGPIAREDSYTGYLRRKYQGGQGSQGGGVEKLIIGKPLHKAVVLTRRRNKRKLMQESYQSCYAITY